MERSPVRTTPRSSTGRLTVVRRVWFTSRLAGAQGAAALVATTNTPPQASVGRHSAAECHSTDQDTHARAAQEESTRAGAAPGHRSSHWSRSADW